MRYKAVLKLLKLWMSLLTGAVLYFPLVALAQVADFVDFSLMPTPPRYNPVQALGSGFSQSEPSGLPNLGSVADYPDRACSSPYINRLPIPVRVTIIAGNGQGRFIHLQVSQSQSNLRWQRVAYAFSSATADAYVPAGALYCPTANDGGRFYVTVLQNDVDLNLALQQVNLWVDRHMPGYYYYLYSVQCYTYVFSRTYNTGAVDYFYGSPTQYWRIPGVPTTNPCPVRESEN